MSKFLDKVGVTTLWDKIKSSFLSLRGGTMKNTTMVKNLNAEYVGGKSVNDLFTYRGYYDETKFPNSIPHTVSGVYKSNNINYSGIATVFHCDSSNSEIMFSIKESAKPRLHIGKDSNRWIDCGTLLTDIYRVKYINVPFNNSSSQMYFQDIYNLGDYTLQHGDVIRLTNNFHVNMIYDVIVEGVTCIVGRLKHNNIIYAVIWNPDTNNISVLKHNTNISIATLNVLSDQNLGMSLTANVEMRFTFKEYMNILGLERLDIQVNWKDLRDADTEFFLLDFKYKDDDILESVAPITNFKEIEGELNIVTIKRIIIFKNTEYDFGYSVVCDKYIPGRNTITYDDFNES